jgi:hypothetical protein
MMRNSRIVLWICLPTVLAAAVTFVLFESNWWNFRSNIELKDAPSDANDQISQPRPSVPIRDSDKSLLEPTSENKIIESIYDRGLDYINQAHAAAEEALEHVAPESVLRWEPISIDLQNIVSGKFIGEDLNANFRTPRKLIVVSPFPDVTLQVSMREFEDVGWGATWIGDITSGQGGSLTIHFSPDEQGRTTIQGYIVTDQRNINLTPTNHYGHYVAVEMNPNFNAKID